MPVVLSGRPFAHESRTPLTYVDADNVGGAMAAVRLLAQLGRTRIATITGPLDMAASVDRVDGFRAELAAHDVVDAGSADGDFSIVGGGARCSTCSPPTPRSTASSPRTT